MSVGEVRPHTVKRSKGERSRLNRSGGSWFHCARERVARGVERVSPFAWPFEFAVRLIGVGGK